MLTNEYLEDELFFPVDTQHPDGFKNSADFLQVYRIHDDGSKTLLSSPTRHYALVTNKEIYKPILAMIDNKNGVIQQLDVESSGARNWLHVDFPDEKVEMISGNETIEVMPRLILKNSYDQSLKFGINLAAVNTSTNRLFRAAKSFNSFQRKHTGNVKTDVTFAANTILEMIQLFKDDMIPFFNKLAAVSIDDKSLEALLEQFCTEKMGLSERRVEQIEASYLFPLDNNDKPRNLFSLYSIICKNLDTLPSTSSKETYSKKLFNTLNGFVK